MLSVSIPPKGTLLHELRHTSERWVITRGKNEDWVHISETINMLYLAVCQIETTMTDANDAVETLTASFAELANHSADVSAQVQNLTKVEELDAFKQDISQTATAIQSNINGSVRAFQLYNRVCQRVDRVARSLEKVSKLLEDKQQLDAPIAWRDIQEKIKSSYTMEAERIMFEYIMRGGTMQEALDIYYHHFSVEAESSNDGDYVELF